VQIKVKDCPSMEEKEGGIALLSEGGRGFPLHIRFPSARKRGQSRPQGLI